MHYAIHMYISWLWYMIMVEKNSVAPDAKSVSENQEYQVKMASKI